MQNTFVKTIHSKQVEFSRLLYPLRYKAFIRIDNQNPVTVVIQKNEQGSWYINVKEEFTPLLEKMSHELIETIKENEAKHVAVSL